MLEIIALVFLVRKISEIVESKGHRSLWYKVMTVGLWFGGEIVGAFVGAFLFYSEGGECAAYIFALVGAAVGATAAYMIANNLSPVAKAPTFDEVTPFE